jgi:UDP-N-acetyl-D-galactosamine dehydrogenase
MAKKIERIKENVTIKEYKKLMNGRGKPVLIDIKGLYNRDKAIKEGFLYWRL